MALVKILLLACILGLAFLQEDSRGLITKKMISKETLTLQENEKQTVLLPLDDLGLGNSTGVSERHAIIVEIKSLPNEPSSVKMNNVIDVKARMNAPGHLDEFINIKDTFPPLKDKKEGNMIYHYVVYDLCYLSHQIKVIPSIELEFESLDGVVKSEYIAKVVEFKNLKINCVDPQSDWFLPREDHASCQTWDQKVWVYGGRRNIDDQVVPMGDIMKFDSKLNRWFKAKENSSIKPKPRYAHSMFCYFNYLIIFGGMSYSGEILGDLWVYDIVKETWISVMDINNVLDLQIQNITGFIPEARAYASSIMMKVLGAGYLVGGKNREGFACDLWALKVDKVIQHIEDPESVSIENFWVQKDFNQEMKEFCRFGHSVAEVTNTTFLIYGGIDQNSDVISYPVLYNVVDQTSTQLDERGFKGGPMKRNKPALLSTGNKMVIMYGGVDPERKGYLTDLWHLKIDDSSVIYEKVEYETKGTAYMVSWRTGFTMEYLRGINDPHLIGGSFGNNQQSQALISIPEQECANKNEFDTTTCSPCPKGSVYSPKIQECRWCEQYEYFEENFDDYFKSVCMPCPRGLIGGNYRSCVPCAGGYVFDVKVKSHCRECTQDEVCPLGTKYAFERKQFNELLNDVKINNVPKIMDTYDVSVDHTATYIVLILVFLTLIFSILIAITLTGCKERFMFIFREIDSLAITGGRRKKVVGGILMIFFLLYLSLIFAGYIISFLVYNERRESSETQSPFLQKEMPTSFEIEIQAYGSKVKESNTPFLIYDATKNEDPDPNPDDLCEKYKQEIDLHNTASDMIKFSSYFRGAKVGSFKCERNRLNDFTDEYNLKIGFKDIPKGDIKDQIIYISLKSDYSYAFHFFRWKFTSVWKYGFEDYPTAFSEIEGVMTPQKMLDSNKNITKAFKGPEPTSLHMSLIPTHYVNEIEGKNHKGYRVQLNEFSRGSTVNKRNLVNRYIAGGRDLQGLNIQFIVNSSDRFYQVRIQRIKSILEVIAYMLGFLAGFIIIVRAAKYYLLRETYFLEIEKQCEQYYGRHDELKYEEEDDVTNIELMRLERTRHRNRISDESRVLNTSSEGVNRDSMAHKDEDEFNEDDENDLKKLAI
ncbi:unnamed protein product [Moneuplotes crassus]|uniref:Tyrosine-protein kinase ephrin type A/B receptor-like domain-containing protein n=2 Tax=Euplotes crassus TaxID=5936 RepID=A0AAD1XQ35_EUPCR|nr:unnamed protein product [Moneuplotes crassus]